MEHEDSEDFREKQLKDILRTGRNAAIRWHLQPADVDACAVDFTAHITVPSRWRRWESVGFSEAWLNACAGNYATNCLKRASAVASHEIPEAALESRLLLLVDPGADPEQALIYNEQRNALDAVISRLNERQRIALSLRYWEECPISQISHALLVSDDAASKIIVRALATLRGHLTRCGFDPDSALRDFAHSHASIEQPYIEGRRSGD